MGKIKIKRNLSYRKKMSKVTEISGRRHHWLTLTVLHHLNNLLACADSAAGKQYSRNGGNPRNGGDPRNRGDLSFVYMDCSVVAGL